MRIYLNVVFWIGNELQTPGSRLMPASVVSHMFARLPKRAGPTSSCTNYEEPHLYLVLAFSMSAASLRPEAR